MSIYYKLLTDEIIILYHTPCGLNNLVFVIGNDLASDVSVLVEALEFFFS
jgi:hypothetical protein